MESLSTKKSPSLGAVSSCDSVYELSYDSVYDVYIYVPNTTGPGSSVEVKNIYFSAAKSVSLASIAHGTIHGSNTGPTKLTFVNF
jgi:hypothetical protein